MSQDKDVEQKTKEQTMIDTWLCLKRHAQQTSKPVICKEQIKSYHDPIPIRGASVHYCSDMRGVDTLFVFFCLHVTIDYVIRDIS